MIRIKDIQEKLVHVVGWQQSYNPLKEIDRELTQTESGLVYQGAHPLMTLDNIEAIMPDDFEMRYPLWNTILEYKVRDKVMHNGKIYIAKEDNHSIEPSVSDFNEDFYDQDFGGAWTGYNFISDYIELETKKGIATAIQKFLRDQSINKGTKGVLLQETFYRDTAKTQELPLIEGRSGFHIRSMRARGVSTRLNRVSLQFTRPGTIKLYLAKDIHSLPERTIELKYTNTLGRPQWFNLDDVYLPGEGEWVLYYNHSENDIDMRAMVGTTVGLGATAHLCGGRKFLDVTPLDQKHGSAGLNVSVTVGCDITDFILEQRGIFATVLQLQVAEVMLRTMAMNPNVKINRHQSNVSKMDILYEIDGNTQGDRPGGLGHDLKKAYEALSLDMAGLDPYCLPCRQRGVRYGVA